LRRVGVVVDGGGEVVDGVAGRESEGGGIESVGVLIL